MKFLSKCVLYSREFGAIFMVAGTALGAGMLTLPLVASSLSVYSVLLLFPIFFLMLYVALLFCEILVFLQHIKGVEYMGIAYIANTVFNSFGRYIRSLIHIAIPTLFYALITAYQLTLCALIKSLNILQTHTVVCFTVFALSILVTFSIKGTDYTNRIFFGIKIILLCIILYSLLGNFNFELWFSSIDLSQVSYKALFIIVPVFFTSFGFHGSIPMIVKYCSSQKVDVVKSSTYNDFNSEKASSFLGIKLIKVIVYGSSIPLIAYTLWICIVFGVLPANEMSYDFSIFLNKLSKNELFKICMTTFSTLAVITSLLGVSLGLIDFFTEILSINFMNRIPLFTAPSFQNEKILKCDTYSLKRTKAMNFINKICSKYKAEILKVISITLTYLPPFFLVLYKTDFFIGFLAFASIPLCIIAVIVPCFIALKIISEYSQTRFIFAKRGFVISALIFGFFVIFCELGGLLIR